MTVPSQPFWLLRFSYRKCDNGDALTPEVSMRRESNSIVKLLTRCLYKEIPIKVGNNCFKGFVELWLA